MLASLRTALFSSVVAIALLGSSASAASFEGLATRVQRTPVYSTCTQDGRVAVTFDDGPWNFEPHLLDELDRYGAKASFFLNGNNYGCIYDFADEIRRAYSAGHLIGSHTWSHASMTSLSRKQMNHELERVETALIKILGVRPKTFRPPYGAINSEAREVLAQRGYTAVMMWDRDTKDADGASVAHSKGVWNKVAHSYPQPHMVLSHETIKTTPYDVIPHALPLLQNRGYKLVSAPVCVGMGSDKGDWYDYVQQPEEQNDSWHC